MDEQRLSPAARAAYADPNNDVRISVISLWEILIKRRIGKLKLTASLPALLDPIKKTRGARTLDVTESAVMRLDSLPDLHRDPFDRMMISQALDEGLTIITPDSTVRGYPVPTLW
jgi:PIN domain nuclease of toxin-antitoxin system